MNQGCLSIRKTEPKDIPVFARIKAAAYADDREKSKPLPEDKPKWYDEEWYIGLGIYDEAETKRLMEAFECYIILLDEIEIGIVWIHQEEEGTYTLEDFCILPEYQGKGYGKQSLFLIEQLKPENRIWRLTTPSFCIRNRHLYEKMGYKQIGAVSEGSVILYEKSI